MGPVMILLGLAMIIGSFFGKQLGLPPSTSIVVGITGIPVLFMSGYSRESLNRSSGDAPARPYGMQTRESSDGF